VDVGIHEPGEQVAAGAIHHLGAVGRLERAGRADLGDLAGAHQHVVGGIHALAGVEDVGGADEQIVHASWGVGVDGSGARAALPARSS
jgi:hypothetical protein